MTKEDIKSVIDESLDSKFREYWVDRELHYKHHEFIDKWMRWADDASKTIWGTLLRGFVLFIMALIALGFFLRFGHGK